MTSLNDKMQAALAEATRRKEQADALKGQGDRTAWWRARREYLFAQARVWQLAHEKD